MNPMTNNLLTALNNVGEAFCRHAAGVFVQSALLVIVLYAVDLLLRKRIRAVFRYCVWLLVLLKLVLPPALSLPTGVGYWAGDHLPSALNVSNRPFDGPGFEHIGTSGERPPTEPSDDVAESASLAAAGNAPLTALTWQAILFILWLVGVLAFLALLVQRARFVRGLIAASTPATAEFAGVLEQCRRLISVRSKTTLRISDTIPSPAVCGFFRPTIVIPAALVDKLSPEALRAILIHELAHIKRGDLWVNSIQTFLQVVYFYNPFVWFANSVIRKVCEEAVDETVLVTLGGRAKDYSNTLIDIGEMAFWRADLGLRLIGVAESRKALQWRIRHMLTRPIPRSSKLGALGITSLLVIAAVLLPMAKAEKETQANRPITTENAEKSSDALQQAVRDGDLDEIKKLLAQGADVNARKDDGDTALHTAAMCGHKEVAKLLIDSGAEVNPGHTWWKPLHEAASEGHKELAKLLLDNGANVNAVDNWTPLHEAADKGHEELAKFLIDRGANVNAGDNWTALHVASRKGHTDVIEVLLANGADVNAGLNASPAWSALLQATGNEHDDATRVLVASGAKLDVKNVGGWTPFHFVLYGGNRDLVDLFVSKGAEVSDFHLAAFRGDLTRVKRFLEQGTDVGTKDNQVGWTPLHWAACTDTTEVATFLIAKGADVKAESQKGWTPLHVAVTYRKPKIAELFVSHGADIHAEALWATPLSLAVENGHTAMVEMLARKAGYTDAQRWIPLHIGVSTGDQKKVEKLLSQGINVNVADDYSGYTALHWAVINGHKNLVQTLIAKGADINAKGGILGATPVQHAAIGSHREVVDILIAKGADIHAGDKRWGTTALHYNASGDSISVMSFLLEKGWDIEATSFNGGTPLGNAVRGNQVNSARLLIDRGANVNVRYNQNISYLHKAVQNANPQIVELLLDAGADVDIKTNDGRTPLDLAKEKGHTEIIELLRKHGAKE